MKTVWPHECFRIDFDQMLEEGRRQEQIHPANKGEYALVREMHSYLLSEVLPLVITDDWVFAAAAKFASDYAMDCLLQLRLGGTEVWETQKRLVELKDAITDFLARAHLRGAAPLAGTVDLTKPSDFHSLLRLRRLSGSMRREAEGLFEEAKDHESLQLAVTLRATRAIYESTLPRVMFVVRRAMKVRLRLDPVRSDDDLQGISETLSWYRAWVGSEHSLYPVLGRLDDFYRVARNVASHHEGIIWEPDSNQVVLRDRHVTLRLHVHEFQQRYRYLVYLCELGVRGILSAFCERERGVVADRLVQQYLKAFPDDFPVSELGLLRPYAPDATVDTENGRA